MRFSIQRETFLKLLRIVSGVVERRHQQNPILSNVLLRAENGMLCITATDQEVELIGQEPLDNIQEPGAITVPFRKLSEICKALPENAELSFEVQADRALIKSGRSRFTLATLPAEQFPDVQKLNTEDSVCHFTIPKKQFRWLLARTAFAMAEQDVRYFLNGMLLEVKQDKLYSVAADGHRLAMNYLSLTETGLPAMRVIVPRKGILEIMRMVDEDDAELTLTIVASHIQAHSGGVTITSKLLDGKFPDYERVIPRDGNKVVIGSRESLKEAFHRASALFSEKFRGVRLRMSNSRLMVLASNPEHDEVEEDLEVDYQGQDIEVGFNVRYLIDFLSVVQSEFVRFTFSDSNKSTLIEEIGEGAKGAYVLMPIRT
jgi:DNA polymerase-3 subunit beta